MNAAKLLKALSTACLALLFAANLRANEGYSKEGMEESEMDSAISHLDLSSSQKDKLKDARRENKEKMQNIWEDKKKHLDRLKELVDSKASDSELESVLKQLKDDHEAMESQEDKFHEQMEDILTPMQKAKMVLRMKSHKTP